MKWVSTKHSSRRLRDDVQELEILAHRRQDRHHFILRGRFGCDPVRSSAPRRACVLGAAGCSFASLDCFKSFPRN